MFITLITVNIQENTNNWYITHPDEQTKLKNNMKLIKQLCLNGDQLLETYENLYNYNQNLKIEINGLCEKLEKIMINKNIKLKRMTFGAIDYFSFIYSTYRDPVNNNECMNTLNEQIKIIEKFQKNIEILNNKIIIESEEKNKNMTYFFILEKCINKFNKTSEKLK